MNRTLDLREMPEFGRDRKVATLLNLLPAGESFELQGGDELQEFMKILEPDVHNYVKLEYIERGPSNWRLRATKLAVFSNSEEEWCVRYGA